MHLSGEVDRLEPTATMIGAFRQWDCEERQVSLQARDTLLIYSDGVTEAESPAGEEFGEEDACCAACGTRAPLPPSHWCIAWSENVNESGSHRITLRRRHRSGRPRTMRT